MLDITQIEQFYPVQLRSFKRNILREYMQYKILEIIFNSPFSERLSFLGGTALRIVYNNARFSEDIDLDNFGVSENEFNTLTHTIDRGLKRIGYKPEIRNVFKGAYRCYIKIPKILFDSELSGIEAEKIMIQIDTSPHDFHYIPDRKILNKFDVFTEIFVTPLTILLSQKLYAILNRKRAKGRDFFDVVFLLQHTKPDYEYLTQKAGIHTKDELQNALMRRAQSIDFHLIAKDVAPFLMSQSAIKKILLFREYIQQGALGTGML